MSTTTPVVNPQIGPLTGPWQVEAACVATLGRWLETYLGEVEEQNGLEYPTLARAPEPPYGAADETNWYADIMPAVFVVCEEPQAEPERLADLGYTVAYRVSAYCVLEREDRTLARRDAALYIAAIAGAIGQQLAGDNPSLVSDIIMVAAPSVKIMDPELQLLYTASCAFDVYVLPVLIDNLGPAHPIPAGQHPGPLPTVTSVNPTIVDVPLTQNVA